MTCDGANLSARSTRTLLYVSNSWSTSVSEVAGGAELQSGLADGRLAS